MGGACQSLRRGCAQKAPLGSKGAHEARALCAEQREVSPMKQGVPQASLRAQWYDHAELRNAVGASRLRGSRSLRHGLRRATVPQFNMVASLRAQSALAMFPVSLGLLRPVSATGGGLRTPLFPSGKRRLLDGAASCDSSTSQKAPFSQKGSCRRQPTEGLTPSPRGARRSPLAEAAPEYRASEAQAGTKTPMKRIKTTFLAN